MSHPRILLAAPKSGSGKTMITCALIRALTLRGKSVQAFKCGPDYIDPMFHAKVLGIPSRNLDLFFTNEDQTRGLFLEDNHGEISVIEGVMGLYDGLGGILKEASSYHLATALKAPIVLVINARGMGRSLLAEIAGFLSMDGEKLIRGVILNQVSEGFFKSIAPVIEEELKVRVLGFFPVAKDLELESRYLGLKLPAEVEALSEKVTKAAEILEKGVNLDALLELAEEAGRNEEICALDRAFLQKGDDFSSGEILSGVRIGVAMDEAFCFYYEDNFRMLRNAGAELVFFSPLRDKALPEGIRGLLLGGGYPELLAKELEGNVSMRKAVREALENGMPSMTECGGFMYLHEAIVTQDGERHAMAGVIKADCRYAGKLVRFGYCTYHVPFPDGGTELMIRGHEFHYYDSDAPGEDFYAVKPVTGKSWRCGYLGESHLWSFGHLYYPSRPEVAKWFVDQCAEWKG